ncbi:zinc finger protein 350-like [Aphis craccivora]|uniref:Zinc finger protein 350-like n=1 Tax=Aphis craccivora TaxID=307492 RepID=A0A6G0VZS7_APHCR|nr:zinc finger protein 350-like [Aphis craccivora]
MFQCEQCPLKFSCKINLLAHRKTHLTFLKCHQCTLKFTTKRNLTNPIRHLKKCHGTSSQHPAPLMENIQIAPHISVPNISARTSSQHPAPLLEKFRLRHTFLFATYQLDRLPGIQDLPLKTIAY